MKRYIICCKNDFQIVHATNLTWDDEKVVFYQRDDVVAVFRNWDFWQESKEENENK